MITVEQINKSNRVALYELNARAREFNELNEDLFRKGSKIDLLYLVRIKKKVYLFKRLDRYIGFIWVEKIDFRLYRVHSFYLESLEEKVSIRELCSFLKKGDILRYECRLNSRNKRLIEELGFLMKNHSIEMKRELWDVEEIEAREHVSVRSFQEKRDEGLRCRLQNDIFESCTRIPMTVEDIFLDEEQDYYIKKAGYFLKLKEEYIGYGQLIAHDYYKAVLLVNFGVIPSYRGKGYGKLLLKYIFKEAKKRNIDNIYLRVNHDNYNALGLYSNSGFKTFSNIIYYEFKVKE